jgi:hypothetical protein
LTDLPPDEVPEPVERGRYALYRGEGTGLLIARATGLCETCLACGCGEQQEPIDMSPAGIMRLATSNGFKLPGPRELAKMMTGRGTG